MKAACTDQEFIALWEEHQSVAALSKILKIAARNVAARRRDIEARHNIQLIAKPYVQGSKMAVSIPENNIRVDVSLENGVIIVGSDCHYWPGIISTAHRAFVVAARELKPKMVVINGDAFDGAQVSRHGRIGWEARPNVKQELDAVKDRLTEIENAAIGAKLHWTWGNHDQRFNNKLSAQVGEFEGVEGFNLCDHFPRWKFSMSIMVNSETQIKHRNYNGIHASYNATVKAGVSTVNGHLHSLKVTPWTDLRGTRYGVDTGSLADVWGPQFNYTEDGTRNHRAGFAVLTFYNGQLMPPELLEVVDEAQGLVYFRGQVIEV